MKRFIYIASSVVLLSGMTLTLTAQEERGRAGRDGPRLSPEQRQELQELSPEQRRERMRELREARGNESAEPAPAAVAAEKPEKYVDQLEFRSILSLDGTTQFSLHNPFEARTFWVSAEESRNGVEVVAFDVEKNVLTIRHEGESRELPLSVARVVEMEEEAPAETREQRRARWEARREEFRQLREKWEAAVAESPELQEVQSQFRELGGEFRDHIRAMREAEEGTPEHQQARAQLREMREEFNLLSEYAKLQLRENPNFTERDLENLGRASRMMAFGDRDRRRGGGEGNRGERGERRERGNRGGGQPGGR